MGQDNRIEELEKQIKNLKLTLKEERQRTYVGETHSLHCSDGELYIGYDYFGEDSVLIMEVNQLYRDLPSIIDMVCKEASKEHNLHLKNIKEKLSEI